MMTLYNFLSVPIEGDMMIQIRENDACFANVGIVTEATRESALVQFEEHLEREIRSFEYDKRNGAFVVNI